MKKIYVPVITLLFFSFVISSMVSCKKNGFLAQTVTTNLTQSAVFADSANTVYFLANIYSNVGFAVSASRFVYTSSSLVKTPCGGLDAACDESEVSHPFATTALSFANGSINALSVTDDAYNTCYTNIRACNQLLLNLPKSPINPNIKAGMRCEAIFLRAWYYSILLQHYGGVRIVGDDIYTYVAGKPNVINTTRNTLDETIQYISAQCDTAAKGLTQTQTGLNYGRASAIACAALKARVLLYSASPLYNAGTVDASNHLICHNDISIGAVANRWLLAKNAYYYVMLLNKGAGGYFKLTVNNPTSPTSAIAPGQGFEEAFVKNRVNSEAIFQFMHADGIGNTDLENLFNPPSRTGKNGAFPYQGIVDAFPMNTGVPITDPASGYDPTNPYVHRDPRLKYTVLYNGHLLGNRTVNGQIIGYSPVDIALHLVNGSLIGGQDAVYQGTPTGYYNNKMVDSTAISEGFAASSHRNTPLITWAEVLLSYAEAYNECGKVDSAYTELEAIRARAGIVAGTILDPSSKPTYGLPAGMGQADMRVAIQNERRLELAYQGFRFFDVRRWKIAEQTEPGQKQGMEVDINDAATTYKIFNVRNHAFRTAMYFWPFPQNEVYKGGGLKQNPGY